MRPTAPALAVITNAADSDDTMDRSPPSAPTLFSAPVLDDFVFTPGVAGRRRVDGDPDGQRRTIKQTQPFSRCMAGGAATSRYDSADVDITGDGITGAHGGSGLSAIGGTLRVGELRPGGPPVRHALKSSSTPRSTTARCATYRRLLPLAGNPGRQLRHHQLWRAGRRARAGRAAGDPDRDRPRRASASRPPGRRRPRLHVAELRRLRRRRHRLGGLRPLRRARTRRRLHRRSSRATGGFR